MFTDSFNNPAEHEVGQWVCDPVTGRIGQVLSTGLGDGGVLTTTARFGDSIQTHDCYLLATEADEAFHDAKSHLKVA